MNQTNEKRCSNCGTVGGAYETVCRRCGVGLTASPYVDAIVNPPGSWGTPPPPPAHYAQPAYAPYAGAPGAGPAASNDAEHLRWLSYGHYALGGLVALLSCIPFIHLFLGIAITAASVAEGQNGPPAFVGIMFALFGAAFILVGWTIAGCILAAGRFLKQRRRRTFCLVVAAIACMWAPLGTALGVFSIIVLMRPSVKALFEASPAQ